MVRVKGGYVTRRRRKRILKLAKGYYGAKHRLFKKANEQLLKSFMLCISRPSSEQAQLPQLVDRAHQCGSSQSTDYLQQDDAWFEACWSKHQSQDACRPGSK